MKFVCRESPGKRGTNIFVLNFLCLLLVKVSSDSFSRLKKVTSLISCLIFLSLKLNCQNISIIPDLRTHSTSHPNSDQLAEKYEYYYDYWSEREIKHGRISRWNKAGVLIYEASYSDNELDGLEEIFNEEGNLISSIDWKMGVKDGKEIHYFDSGGERLIIPYNAGEKEGLEKSYYRSGRIKWVITYRAGKKEGAANYFKKDGALKKSLIYKNGIKQKEKKEKKERTPEKTAHEITI